VTYRSESAQLARHLALLSTNSGSRYLDADGLAVALLGRHETVRLMQETMAVATARDIRKQAAGADTVGNLTLGEVVNHPVEALRQAMAGYPVAQTPLPFLDVRVDSLRSDTAQTWHRVARSAIIARHDLSTEHGAYGPEHRWSMVADVAAMTPVVQNLDRQLLLAARRVRPDDERTIRALERAGQSPATILALEADAVARTGVLPDLSGLRVPPSSTRPSAVTSLKALLEAQRRIPAQLERAEEIRPDVIARTALGQARILLTSARLLEPDNHRRSVELARSMATRISEQLHPEPRDVTALVPGDTTPLVQTALMWQHLRHHRPEGAKLRGAEAIALRRLINHAPLVVDHLARAAKRQLSSGRWLISYSDAATYTWGRYNYMDDAPRLVTALNNLRAAFPATDPSRPTWAELSSARTTLGHRTSKPSRHERPATPDLAVGPRPSSPSPRKTLHNS